MSIQLSTNTLKTRESTSDSWEASAVIVQSDLDSVLAITGDGVLDSSFTATDLTGAVNENKSGIEAEATTRASEDTSIKNTLTQLDQNMAYVESGNTASRQYYANDYISWQGILYKATTPISSGTSFNAGSGGNLSAVQNGGLNNLKDYYGSLKYSNDYICANIAGVKSQLFSLAMDLPAGESRLVRIVHTDSTDRSVMAAHVRYEGYLITNFRNSAYFGFSWLATSFYGCVVCIAYDVYDVNGDFSNGTWRLNVVPAGITLETTSNTTVSVPSGDCIRIDVDVNKPGYQVIAISSISTWYPGTFFPTSAYLNTTSNVATVFMKNESQETLSGFDIHCLYRRLI